MVFKSRVLRRIFAHKKEVTGEWKRLHSKELHDVYYSLNTIQVIKSRRIRLAGHVACMGDSRGAQWILVGRLEGRKPPGKPTSRQEDNIKMDLQ
jgi:hypothetical protein